MNGTTKTAAELLRETKIAVDPATYVLLSLTSEQWEILLQDPSLSPRMTAPFMIFFDGREVTLLLDEDDHANVRGAIPDAKTERGFRLLTFDIELEMGTVGYIALAAKILAEGNIPVVPLGAFSRDHLLIKQNDLAAALKALGPHVAELC
jgi:hypothetical protein